MNIKQAQEIIKAVLDQAIKAGVIQNIDAAKTVAHAWELIKTSINESPDA